MGDYTGVVPETTDLCAKVASDCNNPDIMFYSVSSCENRSHVYEGEFIQSIIVILFRAVAAIHIFTFRSLEGHVNFEL